MLLVQGIVACFGAWPQQNSTPLKEGILLELPKVLRRPGQPLKEVPPMDPQTVIALCAVFTVVLGIIGISRRK